MARAASDDMSWIRNAFRKLERNGYYRMTEALGHQQQPYFPSETPGCSSRLWWLWRSLVPSDREIHASCCPGNGSRWICTSCILRSECGDVSAPSERQVCYTLHRSCSYAVGIYTMPGDVYIFLRLSATFLPLCYCRISDAALSPYMFNFGMLSLITIQSLLRIHHMLLHWLCHYRILHVWNILSNLHTH
jgi:hypothetical protein